jgi:hypothetical protein
MTNPADPVEVALRDSSYLEDQAFTDGVMRELPPRRVRPRGAVMLVAGVVAGLFGAATLGEPVTAAVVALGASTATATILGGALLALAAGVLLRTARE